MPLVRKAFALSLGLSALLSAVTVAQAQKPSSAGDELRDIEATVDWFQKSDVSALREGVIDKMELRIGMEVGMELLPDGSKRGGLIGVLHKEVADLAVNEARIQANGQGALLKAEAQIKLALSVVNRNDRLLRQGKGLVSQEEVEKAVAELAAAAAAQVEAKDTQELAKAKLKSAERAAEEHFIRAPFAGQILREYKHEGESVRANEPVVELGNLDKVRVWGYIPVEYAYRVRPGCEIMIQPRLGKESTGRHPIEQKVFRGAISSVDKSIQSVGENGVRVFADIENPDHELMVKMKAVMTIKLKPEGGTSYATPAPRNQVSNTAPSVGSRGGDLPPLPR